MSLVVNVGLVLLVGLAAVVIPVAFDAYMRVRGRRLVNCPEDGKAAVVDPDPGYAALSALVAPMRWRLRECTRWPEKKDCAQGCLPQIVERGDDSLVANVVRDWYHNKQCARCGVPLERLPGRELALLTPSNEAKRWSEIPMAHVPDMLASWQPLCWNCYIGDKLRENQLQLSGAGRREGARLS